MCHSIPVLAQRVQSVHALLVDHLSLQCVHYLQRSMDQMHGEKSFYYLVTC